MTATTNRSTFVTVLAWIFIVLSGWVTLIAILQNIMVGMMFERADFGAAMHTPPPGAPPFFAFAFAHLRWFVLAILVFAVLSLASSIGLLLRKNWARIAFVALMLLGIVWNLGGVILQAVMFSTMREQFQGVKGAPDMRAFLVAVSVFSAVFSIGFSCLYGWIAKRLLAPDIAAEFGVPMRGAS